MKLSEINKKPAAKKDFEVLLVNDSFEKDETTGYNKDNQSKVVRLLQVLDDAHIELSHYDKKSGESFLCGKTPTPYNREGVDTFYFAGDCVLCDAHEAEKATGIPYNKTKVSKRNYAAYLLVEQQESVLDEKNNPKLDKDGNEVQTYTVKGWKAIVTDLFFPNGYGTYKALADIDKNPNYKAKGGLLGRWLAVDERGKAMNYESVSPEDKKRKVVPIDLSERLAKSYEDYNVAQHVNPVKVVANVVPVVKTDEEELSDALDFTL